MSIPANPQQAALPWGAEAVYLCYGPQGGPFTIVDTGTPLPVSASVSIPNPLPVSQSGGWSFTLATATSGGCTPYSYIAAGSSNQDSQVVKNAAGQLYGYQLFNTTSSDRYVKIYDKATGPTSADTPKKRIYVPAKGGANMPTVGAGVAFASGIGIRITTGPADSDTGAAATNDVLVNLDYA
jgi:hypothetical protein